MTVADMCQNSTFELLRMHGASLLQTSALFARKDARAPGCGSTFYGGWSFTVFLEFLGSALFYLRVLVPDAIII